MSSPHGCGEAGCANLDKRQPQPAILHIRRTGARESWGADDTAAVSARATCLTSVGRGRSTVPIMQAQQHVAGPHIQTGEARQAPVCKPTVCSMAWARPIGHECCCAMPRQPLHSLDRQSRRPDSVGFDFHSQTDLSNDTARPAETRSRAENCRAPPVCAPSPEKRMRVQPKHHLFSSTTAGCVAPDKPAQHELQAPHVGLLPTHGMGPSTMRCARLYSTGRTQEWGMVSIPGRHA